MKRLNRLSVAVLLVVLLLAVGEADTLGLKSGDQFLEEVRNKIKNVGTDELKKLVDKNWDVVLIDVRTAREIGVLGGTIDVRRHINIPRGWLEFRATEAIPDKDTPIVVYCGKNLRSPLAADTLMNMGYTNVSNYSDGFSGWKEAGLPIDAVDKAPGSVLYSKPQKVIEGVWSAIGATAPPTYENSGHNNNLSFVITDDGVLVVNAGDNYLLAKALHEEIGKVTGQPVKYVVLENGQGHAMLGSSYWQEQGVPVIAHEDAAREIEQHGLDILDRMENGRKDKALGTRVVMPDITFEDKMVIEIGSERIELLDLGPAHSPGDIVVWLPNRRLVISGDMAFHQRLLPVFEHTDTAGWIETWGEFAALDAAYVIPGHGEPTNMEEVTKYTRGYLAYMRERIGELIDQDGDLQEAYTIDQSAYSHLDTFQELARQNAGRIFRAMEFE